MDIVIKGEWLKIALIAQGVTPYRAAKLIGERPDKIYSHINSKNKKLCSESLAQLAHALPTMNMRYILTGEGSPLLPLTPPH